MVHDDRGHFTLYDCCQSWDGSLVVALILVPASIHSTTLLSGRSKSVIREDMHSVGFAERNTTESALREHLV